MNGWKLSKLVNFPHITSRINIPHFSRKFTKENGGVPNLEPLRQTSKNIRVPPKSHFRFFDLRKGKSECVRGRKRFERKINISKEMSSTNSSGGGNEEVEVEIVEEPSRKQEAKDEVAIEWEGSPVRVDGLEFCGIKDGDDFIFILFNLF